MFLAVLTLGTLILMALTDVSIVLFGVIYLTNISARVSLLGLKISFWIGLSLIVIFLLLSAFTWRPSGISYLVSTVVCFASSLCLTGAAGFAILSPPWKYFALLPLVGGVTLFGVWFRTFRPLTM